MRIILAAILALLTMHKASAQLEAKVIDFNNKLEINLEKETFSQSFGERFYSVNVIDARDDTGTVGYYYIPAMMGLKYGIKRGDSEKGKNKDAWSKVYYCSPTLKDGLTEWINVYLQCRKNDSAKNKLLIVVKKLWLSPEADKSRFADFDEGRAVSGWDAGVLCKLEFYMEKDSAFYPLYRIDSVFTYREKLNDFAGLRFVDNSGWFIVSALKSSLDKMADINLDEVFAKRRKLLYKDISREYSNRKEVPVLKAVTFKMGVYKNFEEFKANSPSINDYELRAGKVGDILFVKEGTSEYPTRNAWGYCDGKDIFINSGDKYSKLVRRENTFYFFGIKELTRKNKHVFLESSGLNYAANSGKKKSVYKLEVKYYQVDMETGEAY